MVVLTTSSRIRNRIKGTERYSEGGAISLTLHQTGSLSAGKIVKVNDKIGIVSNVILNKGGE